MGSLGAMVELLNRYFQDEINEAIKLVSEGIEEEFKGQVSNVLFQLTGGLRSGMDIRA